jgi:hypothetical protein
MKQLHRATLGNVGTFCLDTTAAAVVTVMAVMAVCLAVGSTAEAVEVELNDGTVITATSYTVTGSFVTLTLENGSQVAFALEDVDLDSLRRAEEELAAEQDAAADEDQGEAQGAGSVGGHAFGQAIASNDAGSAVVVTDKDVSHVRPSAASGDEEGEQEEAPAAGGGSVTMKDYRLEEVSPGNFRVQGTVFNGSGDEVVDVKVTLKIKGEDGSDLSTAELPVSGSLVPDQSASFTHSFSGPQGRSPNVETRITWLGRGQPADGGEGGEQ